MQGKVLYAEVSEWTAEHIEHAADYARSAGLRPRASNQPQYSMLARGIERDIIPLCEREGIDQVVFSPLAQGILTGKYKLGQLVPEGSRLASQDQSVRSGVLDPWVHDHVRVDDALLDRVQHLRPIAQEAGLTMPQMALAQCLRQKNVSSVIIGATRPDQVDDNAAASGKTLPPDLIARREDALAMPAEIDRADRGCC